MAEHNKTGDAGEKLAARYLTDKGYVVIAKNYRYKKGEIDIIALKDGLMVFAEVKTRRGTAYGEPEDFVGIKKAGLILRAAENYIFAHNWQKDIRFDVISIYWKHPPEIFHFEDAFY